MAGALLVLGDDFIAWFYDRRYAGAGWMLSALAVTLAVTSLNTFDQCLIAMRRMKRLSVLNAVRLVLLYSFVPIGHALFGARGAIAAIAAAALSNALVLLVVQRRMGLLDARRELTTLPLFAAGMLAGWIVERALA